MTCYRFEMVLKVALNGDFNLSKHLCAKWQACLLTIVFISEWLLCLCQTKINLYRFT